MRPEFGVLGKLVLFDVERSRAGRSAHGGFGRQHDLARRGRGPGRKFQCGGNRVVGDTERKPVAHSGFGVEAHPNSNAARATCGPTARCSIHVAPPPG